MAAGIRRRLPIVAISAIVLLGACARYSVETGKQVLSVEGLERFRTTRQEILQKFGPPQAVDDTRGALYGENHLAYERRRSKGWHGMLYVPIPLLRDLPIVGFCTSEEKANTTVFLFDEAGRLVDHASAEGPVARRVGMSLLCWASTRMLLK